MIRRCTPLSIGSTVLATAVSLFANNAAAADYSHYENQFREEGMGNNHYYASYFWNSSASAQKSTGGGIMTRSAYAVQGFGVYATVLNNTQTVLYGYASGYAEQKKVGTAASTYMPHVSGQAILQGTEYFNDWGAMGRFACGGHKSCISYGNGLEKTLFYGEHTFYFAGFIPITVHAGVYGGVWAGLEATSSASKYLGMTDSLLGDSVASLNTNAWMRAEMGAYAGISGVVGLGVTLHLHLIQAGITSRSNGKHATANTGTARLGFTNSAPVTFSTMNGHVAVTFDYLVDDYNETILSWTGWSRTAWNFFPPQNYYVDKFN